MVSEWPIKSIAECAADEPYSTQIGPFGKALTPEEYTESGVPLLRGVNVNHGRFHDDDYVFISEETADRLAKFESFPGDVLLVHKGTLGKIGLMPKNRRFSRYIMGNSMLRVRCNPAMLIPEYLYYWLSSTDGTNYLLSRVSQVGVPQIQQPLTTLRQCRLPVPPPREQRAIACVLGALEDKIELNQRRNRTLEAMARAIFQSWFVDFDPVCAKAAGRKPAALSKEIAALFSDSFEDSILGPVPARWSVTSLADQITASKGLSYKGEFLCEPGEGLPMHNLNSVYEGGGYKNEGLKWYKGEYRPAHLLQPGDVIVTNTEQGFDHLLIGYASIVPERFGPQGLFSHHIYRIRPRTTSYLPAWFTYLLLRTPRFHELVAGHSNGTTVNMLPLDGLQKPRFVLPPEELVKRFGKLFLPMQEQLELTNDENASLAALRDALLPKLISGELRVPDAERIVRRTT